MIDAIQLRTAKEHAHREGLQEGRQEGLQEGRQEGLQEGRREGRASLLLQVMAQRVGDIPSSVIAQINSLPAEQQSELFDALLNFNLTSQADVDAWFRRQ
ncbi:MAG: DUF4351 domain-containing protein [Capsulimonadaceae bacterium]